MAPEHSEGTVGAPALFTAESCQAPRDLLARVGDKWSMLVVMLLGGGPMRFNQLRRTMEGISQRMLTLTLRGLERDGLVSRTVYPSIPPRVDYALTPLGRSLIDPVAALSRWAHANQGRVHEARAAFDRREGAGDPQSSAA